MSETMTETWTQSELQEYIKSGRTPNRDRVAISAAKPKQGARHEPVAAEKTPRLASPCRVTLHHFRTRLCDVDNLYGKAVIDGLRHCGILANDSPEEVAEVVHKQTKSKDEKTTITIEELE